MMRPASSTATMRRSSTAPVSVSTSTTATCAPNGNVGCAGLKISSALSSSSRPSALQAPRPARPRRSSAWASRPRGSRRRRGRARCRRRSPRAARRPAAARARRPRCAACAGRDAADLGRLRAVRADTLAHLVGVSLDDRDRSSGRPSRSATIIANVVSWPWPCENEPVRRMASPSGGDLDRAELRLDQAVRDLDVDADADARARRVPPCSRGRRCSSRSAS